MPAPRRHPAPATGFTLLELMLVVAAVAILLVALLPGAGVLDAGRSARARQEIETLRTAAERWLERGRLDYAGVSVTALQDEGLLPEAWTGATPWGGSYAVGPDTGDTTRLAVTVMELPAAVATRLAAQLAAAGWTATAEGGTLSANW